MRLGRKNNICIRIFPAHFRPQWKRANKLLVLWITVLVLCIALTTFYRRVSEVIRLVSERHAVNLAVRLIHEAVNEQIVRDGFIYADFVTVHTDEEGKVQSLTVNSTTVNKLKAEVALAIEQKVSAMTNTSVCVPYAAFFSDDLAVGIGPYVECELAPAGYCFVDFENSFEATGINQTKHQIDIVVKANFTMMTAMTGTGVTVETSLPVAQTVIVGTVPNSYFEIQK